MEERNRSSNLKEKIAALPKHPGVYLFKDGQGVVLYVGKAKDLRSRVASYFQPAADLQSSRGPAIAEMIERVTDVDVLECESEVEALLQENRLIKDIQPAFNERLTDDKSFPYLEIALQDEYPGVYVTREPGTKSKLFGPFVNVRGLRAAVQELQRVFRFRTCRLDIREDDPKRKYFRPCLLYAIRQCTAPCADRIGREDYRGDVQKLVKFLSSKRSVVLGQMRRQMRAAADRLDFETAAKLRDQLQALESLDLSGRPDVHLQPEVFFLDPKDGLEKLAKLLELDAPPRIIEGFDIANLQDEEACGSLVCFIDGMPFKSGYKRFRIKTVEAIDDYAMIREVVARRYRHVAEGEELFPDLILIDGGLGHLHTATEAVRALGLNASRVIALAKKNEEVYTDRDDQPISLSRHDPALRLLQRIRDEAHRFAQHYHHILRRKKVVGE